MRIFDDMLRNDIFRFVLTCIVFVILYYLNGIPGVIIFGFAILVFIMISINNMIVDYIHEEAIE